MGTIDLLTVVLASAGGSTLVVAGLAGWIGKLAAERMLEQQKAENARTLEQFKSSLELTRIQQRRNSDALFQLYTEVWRHLIDLKSIGDELWEHASREHLELFVTALKNAQFAANRGRLMLPEGQYRRLEAHFKAFEGFQLGKLRLIELRSSQHFDLLYQSESEAAIKQQIGQNRQFKQDYETCIDEVLTQFRSQLGLPSDSTLQQTGSFGADR